MEKATIKGGQLIKNLSFVFIKKKLKFLRFFLTNYAFAPSRFYAMPITQKWKIKRDDMFIKLNSP